MQDDPVSIRDQAAIGHGRRRQWLVPAGLLTGITIGLMIVALDLQKRIPITGIIVMSILYASMLIIALVVEPVRRRNVAFAWVMCLIGAAALTLLLLLLIDELSAT